MRVWIDLDGTLTDPSHRLQWLERTPPDWEGFLSRAVDDPPHEAVVSLARALEASPRVREVRYVSARSEEYRAGTETWLAAHRLRASGERLVMRAEGDRRVDQVVKAEFLAAARAAGEGPNLVVDDRPRVIAMWRDEGVTCLDTGTWRERTTSVPERAPTLYLMVGPSGAGKTHALENGLLEELGLPARAVVSTDGLREELCLEPGERWTDEHARTRAEGRQDRNRQVFDLAYASLGARLDAGLDAVLDATSLTVRERRRAARLANDRRARTVYLVLDRPLKDKLATRRPERPEALVRKHDQRFRSALGTGLLAGDGDARVEVRDLRGRTAELPPEPVDDMPPPTTGPAPYATPRRLPPMAELATLCERTDGFVARRGTELVSLDYQWMDAGMWDDPRLRECRGLLFDAKTGQVAARPFHKFHNWGEIPHTDGALDFAAPHQVQEKHDGTLFYPARLSDGRVLWCTRAGRTELAERLEADLPSETLRAIEEELLWSEDGATPATPLFEHTSEWNRIVLRYDETSLTWLASRDRDTGRYWTRAEMVRGAERVHAKVQERTRGRKSARGFSLVREHGCVRDPEEYARQVREREDEEGIVVAFESGHRVKMKTRAYVVRHRVRDDLRFEHRVLEAVAKGATDDLSALVAPDAREALHAYEGAVRADVGVVAGRLRKRLGAHAHRSRKDYACAVRAEGLDALEQALSFRLRDRWEREGAEALAPGEPEREVLETLARQCGKRTRVKTRAYPLLPTARWTWAGAEEA